MKDQIVKVISEKKAYLRRRLVVIGGVAIGFVIASAIAKKLEESDMEIIVIEEGTIV